MAKRVSDMTQERIIGCRRWPAHLTVDQMRDQLLWEESQRDERAAEARAKFTHKQTVAFRRRLSLRGRDGSLYWQDDWSEQVQIRATKRDMRPMGYWVVQFADGGALSVHEDNLRALEA